MKTPEPGRALWSKAEAAEYLGIKESSLDGLVDRKRIECVIFAHKRRFKPSTLAKFIDDHTQKAER